MKKGVLVMLLVLPLLILAGGCATLKTPSEFSGGITDEQAVICMEQVRDRELWEDQRYDELDPNVKHLALMHKETMSMVKEVFGKGEKNPCTNVWDAYIVYAQEVGSTNRVVAKEGMGALKHLTSVGAGAFVAGEVVDALKSRSNNTTTTVGGDYEYTGRDKFSGGEGSISPVNEYPITTTTDTYEGYSLFGDNGGN